MLPALLLTSIAFAGWTETDTDNDCTFYKGSTEGSVTPVRAECTWPIPPAKLQALLLKTGDHDKYFSAVGESTVKSSAGGVDHVYQRHEASGIDDRELMLDMGVEDIPNGKRYTWVRSANQHGVTNDNVQCVLDTGKWEISAGPNGGSTVAYELRYDAGGSVPGFLVRWFQGAGMQALVGELRSYAEDH